MSYLTLFSLIALMITQGNAIPNCKSDCCWLSYILQQFGVPNIPILQLRPLSQGCCSKFSEYVQCENETVTAMYVLIWLMLETLIVNRFQLSCRMEVYLGQSPHTSQIWLLWGACKNSLHLIIVPCLAITWLVKFHHQLKACRNYLFCNDLLTNNSNVENNQLSGDVNVLNSIPSLRTMYDYIFNHKEFSMEMQAWKECSSQVRESICKICL